MEYSDRQELLYMESNEPCDAYFESEDLGIMYGDIPVIDSYEGELVDKVVSLEDGFDITRNLMHLKFGLAECETVCTDMKRVLWDPNFLRRITFEEVQFVMLHEVMHCVLNHIHRGKGKIHKLYNLSADIVVNSIIMQAYAVKEFQVDDESAMHLAPNGIEGRMYTAEQVYEMLISKYENFLNDVDALCDEVRSEYGIEIDNHDIWDVIPVSTEFYLRERTIIR